MAVTARKRPGFYQAFCTLTDQIGDAVYVTPLSNGGYKVKRCNPTSPSMMPAWGVIIQKFGSTSCIVQVSGEVRGIYSGLIPNKTYSIGVNGRPCYPPEFPGNDFRYHQNLGVAISPEVLYLRPMDPTRLVE